MPAVIYYHPIGDSFLLFPIRIFLLYSVLQSEHHSFVQRKTGLFLVVKRSVHNFVKLGFTHFFRKLEKRSNGVSNADQNIKHKGQHTDNGQNNPVRHNTENKKANPHNPRH